MSEPLSILPTFARLSERVHVILGLNPGKFTLQGTNTYLVGTGPRRILIDTGSGIPQYAAHLRESLAKAGATEISDVICTHRHSDHIGGIPQLLSLHPTTPPQIHKLLTPLDTHPTPHPYTPITHLQTFTTPGATLIAHHTPGHLDDHVVLYLEEEAALFSGDNVLGEGTTVFEDLGEYVRSLGRMRGMLGEGIRGREERGGRIYPGHGPVVEDGVGKIGEYLRHRQDREDQIIALLKSSPPSTSTSSAKPSPTPSSHAPPSSALTWTTAQLVQVIYAQYPAAVHQAAERGVFLHLRKLEEEGKVVRGDGDVAGWRWVGGDGGVRLAAHQ